MRPIGAQTGRDRLTENDLSFLPRVRDRVRRRFAHHVHDVQRAICLTGQHDRPIRRFGFNFLWTRLQMAFRPSNAH